MAAILQLIPFCLVSNGPFVRRRGISHSGAYDQVVALTSVRQREIKHATVRRHTRRIKLQLLTCDIKKPASIRHVDKRDTESGEKEEGDRRWMMSEEMKGFQLLIDYYSRG